MIKTENSSVSNLERWIIISLISQMLKFKSSLTTRINKNKTSARHGCTHALSLLTGDSKVAEYTRAIRELQQELTIPLKTHHPVNKY